MMIQWSSGASKKKELENNSNTKSYQYPTKAEHDVTTIDVIFVLQDEFYVDYRDAMLSSAPYTNDTMIILSMHLNFSLVYLLSRRKKSNERVKILFKFIRSINYLFYFNLN